MYSFTTLNIRGYDDKPVANTFIKQDAGTESLAVLFPGMRYTTDMPLLYYTSRLFVAGGADALLVDYRYHEDADFMAAGEQERARRLTGDVTAACRVALSQRSYRDVTVVGKSIGSLAMAHLLSTEAKLSTARAVWLTPLLRNDNLRAQIKTWGGKSLFVIGTADHDYDEALLKEVEAATRGKALVIEGGDHLLEVKGDFFASLQALEKILRAVRRFDTE